VPQPRTPDAVPRDLLGGDAAQWLQNRRWGATILDDGLIAVSAHFGANHQLGAWVPADPLTGRHTDFFLQVKGHIERTRDWDRIVSVYEEFELVRQRHSHDELARTLRRFHPVLAESIESPATPRTVSKVWFQR
jgi:hypothetical protein